MLLLAWVEPLPPALPGCNLPYGEEAKSRSRFAQVGDCWSVESQASWGHPRARMRTCGGGGVAEAAVVSSVAMTGGLHLHAALCLARTMRQAIPRWRLRATRLPWVCFFGWCDSFELAFEVKLP